MDEVGELANSGFDAAGAEGGSGSVEAIDAGSDAGLSSLVGQELTESARPELTAARVIVSGGRGMGSGGGLLEIPENR